MDYNFNACVFWFLSNPFLIDILGLISLGLAVFTAILKFGRG
ncbi:hypothetical protein CEB3_c17710 [Peptococcaceae bacterium CEB3]|nr:hypothetical protein CEB3_c17710 [Peptococcaceae bacterium CEB3]